MRVGSYRLWPWPNTDRHFSASLRLSKPQVVDLFGMVAEDLPRATDALLSGNSEVVQALAERDQVIDALYPKIEDLADRADGRLR